MNFNGFDFIIIGIILFSALISVIRGFFREVISLLTWIVAVVLALHFAPMVSLKMVGVISSPNIRYFIAFSVVFLLVLVLGILLSRVFQRLVSAAGMGFTDRLLGVCFGVVRGLLLVTLLLLFITMTPLEQAGWASRSQLFPKFMPLLTRLTHALPAHLRTASHAWLEEWIVTESGPPPEKQDDPATATTSSNLEGH